MATELGSTDEGFNYASQGATRAPSGWPRPA